MITKLLNIKQPILQGSMAYITTYPIVAAVSEAGGLGVLTTTSCTRGQLQKQIDEVKNLTDKPFGINISTHESHLEALISTAIHANPACIILYGNLMNIYVPWIKESGIKVLGVAFTVKEAVSIQEMGADAIILSGSEAGGHIGPTSLLTALPQVVEAVNIPVIAAGGIASGSGLVAALSLGAAGIQMGTAFLVATECPVPLTIKQAIIEASDTGTIVTGRKKGVPVRSLKNKLLLDYQQMEFAGNTIAELDNLTKGSLVKAFVKGEIETGSVMTGEIAGLINKIEPARDIISNIMIDVNDTIKRLCKYQENKII